jgi:hypothetical protein
MSSPSETTNGLTTREKLNRDLVKEYQEHYQTRKNQCRARIRQTISSDYKNTLQMRHQMLRDQSEVCGTQVINCGMGWNQVPLFIKECEKKKFKCDSEILMMELAFPFLAALHPEGRDDI